MLITITQLAPEMGGLGSEMTPQHRTRKRALAGLVVLVLTGSIIGLASAPAFATDTNQPDTWETLPGEVCVDAGYSTEDSVNNPFVLGAAPAGHTWSKVIVKVGSSGHGGVTDENAVYTSELIEGAAFVHPEKDSISHVITCSIPTIVKVTPVGGTPVYGDCNVEGNLNDFVDTAQYTWAFTGPITARIATATAVGDVVLEGQTVFGPYDLSKKSGVVACPPQVIPVELCNRTDGYLNPDEGGLMPEQTPEGLLLDGPSLIHFPITGYTLANLPNPTMVVEVTTGVAPFIKVETTSPYSTLNYFGGGLWGTTKIAYGSPGGMGNPIPAAELVGKWNYTSSTVPYSVGVGYANDVGNVAVVKSITFGGVVYDFVCVTDTKVTPVGGTPVYGDCNVEGNLNGFVDTAQYTWAFTGPITARVATASPVGDVVLEGQTVFGPYDLSKTTGVECPHKVNTEEPFPGVDWKLVGFAAAGLTVAVLVALLMVHLWRREQTTP